MMPLAGRDCFLGFNAKRIVKPPLNEIELQLASDNRQLIALALSHVRHTRNDRAAATVFNANPRPERELVEEAKLSRIRKLDVRLTIHHRRPAARTSSELA